jgi:hypothetical protein
MSNNLIPAGTYKAAAVAMATDAGDTMIQFGVTEKGTNQVVMLFEVLEGQHQGAMIPWYGYLTKDTWETTVKGMRACGFKGDDLAGALTQNLDNEVFILTEVNEWEGKSRARVRFVNASPAGSLIKNAMGADDLRKFSAQMKARLAGVPVVEGKKAERGKPSNATAPSGADAPPPSDDDYPF